MTVSFNEYAWNQVANMVFIESPVGVGYSYSTAEDTTEDYKMNDQETAEDNYDLIQAFMQRFPEYSSNSMYISSESYGGHYMVSNLFVLKINSYSTPAAHFGQGNR